MIARKSSCTNIFLQEDHCIGDVNIDPICTVVLFRPVWAIEMQKIGFELKNEIFFYQN